MGLIAKFYTANDQTNGLTGDNFMFKNTKLVMGMLVCMGGTLVLPRPLRKTHLNMLLM